MTGLSKWSKNGHIYFIHSEDWESSDIRISLTPNQGSYSYIGTDNALIAKGRETLNLGWLWEDMDNGLYGTISHEGGHAIGLGHEHRRVKLKRDVVIDRFSGPPNNWTISQIEQNILNPFDEEQMDLSESIDYVSVMMYMLDKSLTVDGIGSGYNEELSLGDHDFIGKIYPKPHTPEPVDTEKVVDFITALIQRRTQLSGFDGNQLELICLRLSLRADGLKWQKRNRIRRHLNLR